MFDRRKTRKAVFLKSTGKDFISFVRKKEFKELYEDENVKTGNDAKLRISVPINKFDESYNIIMKHLISDDSPIYSFKITNMEESEIIVKELNQIIIDLSKIVENKENIYNEEDIQEAKMDFNDTYNAREDYCRLIDAGQWTLYLPTEMDKTLCIEIAELLEKIINDLKNSNIPHEECPYSDRPLADYISGRVSYDENGKYVNPDKTPTKQSMNNEVLNMIQEYLLNPPAMRMHNKI